ncbi:hypothetical protein, partial [Photobacterium sanguinicancri]|uniref:hypothetical protein n=1 Tax=Photobacterium sanguinicancri TaxID=875932 RepID=UPI00195FDCE0
STYFPLFLPFSTPTISIKFKIHKQHKENPMGGFSQDYEPTQDDLDNHSNQLNDNNDAYWQSRDYDERPSDWESKDE